MACVVPTINLFLIRYIERQNECVSMGFRQGFFEGFFRTRDANASASLIFDHPPPSLPLSRLPRALCYPEPLRAEVPATLREIDGPVWSVSDRGTAGL